MIVIHGLNPRSAKNHAINTFTRKSAGSERLWLRDDFPGDFPDVRVFLYEFDSSVLTSTKTRLIHEASDLLFCLDIERREV
jgi:hypothetical protein